MSAEITASRTRRRTAKEHGPDPIDVGVGRQVRHAREEARLTQVDVGARLGTSFQLVQKYEQGEIRVSASRLFQLASLLEKPIDYFFAAADKERPPPPSGLGRGEMELIQAYRAITNPAVKERLCQLVKGMTQQAGEAAPKGKAKPDP